MVNARGEVCGGSLGDSVVKEFSAEEGREGAIGFFGCEGARVSIVKWKICNIF